EDQFFEALQLLAKQSSRSLAGLIDTIDQTRDRETNLSSAIRLFVLDAARAGKLAKSVIPKAE
ncbi:MAG: ribbon-helix-helix domain-containing protein, partial [Pseudomonadota bacterium]